MELRKRRRAAKLQLSAEKKAKTSVEKASTLSSPPKPARSPVKARVNEDQAKSPQQPSSDTRPDTNAPVVGSPAKTGAKLLLSPRSRKKRQTSAMTNTLRSLYSDAALAKKRQSMQLPGANVPNTFQVTELPVDIVPKTKLAIFTAFPYPFLRSNSQVKKQALRNFVTGNNSNQNHNQSTALRWHQALHYFVHPATPLPAVFLQNRAGSSGQTEPLAGGLKRERKREEKAFLTARWNMWQEAFRDVYMNFRRQHPSGSLLEMEDNSFYVQANEFVVCFTNSVDDGVKTAAGQPASIVSLCRERVQQSGTNEDDGRQRRSRLCAVMSQSNARIRKVLHHRNIPYSMPYITANRSKREAGEFHLLDEEMKAFEASQSKSTNNGNGTVISHTSSTQENMHGADSLLLFHGHDAVHGLYEFLINRTPMSNQDVPELFALHPFLNGTVQSLQVTSFGRVGGSASASEDPQSRESTLFRTEVVGFCFPSSVARLLKVLKGEWQATNEQFRPPSPKETSGGRLDEQVALRTYMEPVLGAERLNAVHLGEQLVDENNTDAQSHQKRQHELEYSKRRVETIVVTKVDSRYNVETTTRPIAVRRYM